MIEYLSSLGNASLDFEFCCLNIDDKHEGIDLLNLLHCRLCRQGVLDDRVLVKLGQLGHRPERCLWAARSNPGLGKKEVDVGANLASLARHAAFHGLGDL